MIISHSIRILLLVHTVLKKVLTDDTFRITEQDRYIKHEGILESVTNCSIDSDSVGSSIIFSGDD